MKDRWLKKIDKIYSIIEIFAAFIALCGFLYIISDYPAGHPILMVGLISLTALYVFNAFYTYKRHYLNYIEQGIRLFSNFGMALCCIGIMHMISDFHSCHYCAKLGLWFLGIYFGFFIFFQKKYFLKKDLRYNIKVIAAAAITSTMLILNS